MMNLTDPIYSDANKAREHLEALHWPDGPSALAAATAIERITKLAGKSTRPGVYKCNECAKPFTVTVGTIFEDSKIPLNKWLLAFRLLNGGKKGFSAHQLHRSLGITYKSAWFMAHRIREAMKTAPTARSAALTRSWKPTKRTSAARPATAPPAALPPRRPLSPWSSATVRPARSTSPTSTPRRFARAGRHQCRSRLASS